MLGRYGFQRWTNGTFVLPDVHWCDEIWTSVYYPLFGRRVLHRPDRKTECSRETNQPLKIQMFTKLHSYAVTIRNLIPFLKELAQTFFIEYEKSKLVWTYSGQPAYWKGIQVAAPV